MCTTELGVAAKLAPEFAKRGVKMIAISCDPVDSHNGWIKDIQAYSGIHGNWPYPIISDPNRDLAVKLGMLDDLEKDKAGLPLTARAVSKHYSVTSLWREVYNSKYYLGCYLRLYFLLVFLVHVT